MLKKKYYDGMQIHDVLCEYLDDYDTILAILEKFASLSSADVPDTNVGDTISRRAAIDAIEKHLNGVEKHLNGVFDGTHYGEGIAYGYEAAHRHIQEVINALPSAEPQRKKMSNKEWVDFLSEQFAVSRTSAREMLHVLMKWKAEDNFKKQFSGGIKERKND